MGRAGMSAMPIPSPAGRRPYPTGRLLDGRPRAILFDAGRCIGCRQCVEACKDANDLPRGNQYTVGPSTWLTIEPPVLEGQSTVWGRNSCMHCEYPLCAAVCPVEAITKYAEGPVVIDQQTCIGCDYCIYACPWGVIAKDDLSGKASKCTMNPERIAAGEVPACVEVCPVEALDFGLVEEMEQKASRRAVELGGTVYGRGEAGGTHVLHVMPQPPAQHGMRGVGRERYPQHRIPLWKKIKGPFTLTGGVAGKWRAVKNALTKPWRLRYRYWHRPESPGGQARQER